MAKRKSKKRQSFDDYEDYDDYVTDHDGENVNDISDGEKLDSFIIEEKVNAFVHGYQPCDEFTDGAVGFDDAKLRELFKAYVCPLGDPMKLYMEHLKLAGFRMTVSVATGELTMFAVRRFEY